MRCSLRRFLRRRVRRWYLLSDLYAAAAGGARRIPRARRAGRPAMLRPTRVAAGCATRRRSDGRQHDHHGAAGDEPVPPERHPPTLRPMAAPSFTLPRSQSGHLLRSHRARESRQTTDTFGAVRPAGFLAVTPVLGFRGGSRRDATPSSDGWHQSRPGRPSPLPRPGSTRSALGFEARVPRSHPWVRLAPCQTPINLVSQRPQMLLKFIACPLLPLDAVNIGLADFLDSATHPLSVIWIRACDSPAPPSECVEAKDDLVAVAARRGQPRHPAEPPPAATMIATSAARARAG